MTEQEKRELTTIAAQWRFAASQWYRQGETRYHRRLAAQLLCSCAGELEHYLEEVVPAQAEKRVDEFLEFMFNANIYKEEPEPDKPKP